MRNINRFLAVLAVPTLLLATAGQAAATRSAQALPGGGNAADMCQVKVSRSASAGVFDVVRSYTRANKCVCNVTTGPRSQGGSAAAALAALLTSRNCADAPLAAAGGAASGGLGGTALVIAGVVAAGGLAAAVASGGNDSPGR